MTAVPPTEPHSARAAPVGRLAPEAASRITRRMALISVCVALFLIALKGGAYLASGSIAMLASLADSTLDLAASLFTFFAVRYAAAPPDREHRFGHGKAEAFAGLFQAGLVAVSAALILVEAVTHLLARRSPDYGVESIFVMLVSVIVTTALVVAQTGAIRQTGSVATAGDRAHYGADLAANGVVILGLGASTFLGFAWADAAAGIFVTLWLVYGAWGVAREASHHLMDHEMPETERARIRALALADARVRGVHDLRTRMSGPLIHIQFHADLDPTITLEAAHAIVVAAEARIRAEFPAADIIIHPDPGDRAEPHGHAYFNEGERA